MRTITHDGRMLRLLTLIDEYTRACLAIRVARRSAQKLRISVFRSRQRERGLRTR